VDVDEVSKHKDADQSELPEMPQLPDWLSADRRKWADQWELAVRQYLTQLESQRRDLIESVQASRGNSKLLTFFGQGTLDQNDAEMIALMLQRLSAQEGSNKVSRLDLLLHSPGGLI